MITRKELDSVLEEIDHDYVTLSEYDKSGIIKMFAKHGLIRITAKEKYQAKRNIMSAEAITQGIKQFGVRDVNELADLADAAIKEAEGKNDE